MEMEQPFSPSFRFGAVAGGLIVLVVGVAMLVDSTGTLSIRGAPLLGPLIMIAIGATMLLNAGRAGPTWDADTDAAPLGRFGRRARRRRHSGFGGLWLIGMGSWMLVSHTHLFGLNFGNSWPLIVIMAGVMIVSRGIR
jgi:putative Mn2+ efflux pump MntP